MLLSRAHEVSMAIVLSLSWQITNMTRDQEHQKLYFYLFYLANPVDSGNPQPSGQMVSHRPPLSLERSPFRSEQKGATNRAVTCSATETNRVWPHPNAPRKTLRSTSLSQTGKVSINLPASVLSSPLVDTYMKIKCLA